MRALRCNVGLLWPGLGLAGSTLISVAATGLLSRRPIHWWWTAVDGHDVSWHLFWAGVVTLCLAWLGLGWRLRCATATRPREVILVAALWGLPLLIAPALFSLDMYSYLAQGALLAHGENPYRVGPAALAHWPQTRPVLNAVSTNWRHTTAPYGPVFLALAAGVSWLSGSHVVLGVMLTRLLELPGIALLAVFVPRLARHAGADPVRALWLALASPLTLLYLLGGGHNDALMIGLLVAGATMAFERRWLTGIALCALAATIKLPGAAGVVVLGACWLRAEPARWRSALSAAAATSLAVALAAGLLAGVGLTWISGSLFSTPASAKNALTPATDIAVTLWGLGHGGWHPGVQQGAAAWESIATGISVVIVAIVCLRLLWRARPEGLVRSLGLVLLAGAIGGPALWPWYICWSLIVLACDPRAQRSMWLAAVAAGGALVVMAGGQVVVSLPHAPRMLVIYAAAAVLAVLLALRRRLTGTSLPHVVHRESTSSVVSEASA